MAYYNGFPATYQPLYPAQQHQAPAIQTPQQTNNNGLIWVQGEQAAKSYLVAPGCTVQLWDSEEKVIYLKSADASGMPSMKILDYTIRGDSPAAPAQEYATKDELRALEEKIREISARRRKTLIEEDADE
jgi:hypothetical protein